MIVSNSYKNIYLARHPKTEVLDGVCYGRSDVLPSEISLEDATKKVKSKLNGVDLDACYSSPLSRCRLLAEQLVGTENVNVDELLSEIDFASWEMTPWSEIPQEQQKEWGEDFINCKIHGGENFFDVQKRIIKFWKQVTQTTNKEILVVSHAGLIRAILAYLLNASPYKIFAIDIYYGDVIQVKWSNENYYKIKFL
ncbi:MAG: phosphoglycerate mutase [Draconibacterium sp.]|nr:MAG: phosphoglycerate mutase [Draconibacterium sp.]PIF06575.1 MAG: phosphoglycerate mutase [Draconibacterium sp.]